MTTGVCPYKMKAKKRGDEWWILGVEGMDPEGMGPYPSKEEAEWHMSAVENTWKYGHLLNYFTVDKDAKNRKPMEAVPREPEPEPPKRRARKPSTAAPVRKKRRKSRKRK